MGTVKKILQTRIAEGRIKEAMNFLFENLSKESSLYKEVLVLVSKFNQLNRYMATDSILESFEKVEMYKIKKNTLMTIDKIQESDLNPQIKLTIKYDKEAFKNSKAANMEEWLTTILSEAA
jgi:hypothetical protein